jgi:ubiquinol-cytochrome c reductase cytochrome c1 subunit
MRLRPVLALFLAATFCAATAGAADPPVPFERANNNVADTASLQRGARYFVNYCLGCHSARYVRYNTLAQSLQLTEEELVENIMFTGERPHDTMETSMRREDAARWFGIDPPDLSLISRSRGTDYVYNFLRGFYFDESAPNGTNNLVLANTAMPHVLWELQGVRRPVYEMVQTNGLQEQRLAAFETVTPGELTERQFDQVVTDIVNFLDFIGEPMQLERRALGVRVIAFLFVFLVVAQLLKREIWKDVE